MFLWFICECSELFFLFLSKSSETWRIITHHSRPSPIIVLIAHAKCCTFALAIQSSTLQRRDATIATTRSFKCNLATPRI